MKWKIGNVKIDNKVVLAPMAGICELTFRRIIKSMGCGLIETEMVSNKAIMNDNERTKKMLYMTDMERPISQQIFGCEVESFRIAAKYIYDNMHPDIIDINMGCPVTKVAIKSKAGSALLKSPSKVRKIVETVVDTVSIPVTVKIRSGWDENSINALEIAEIVEDAGASAIAVHPRTRTQRYDVKADWSIIRQVKEAVTIPVIGNGDVVSGESALAMMRETGCDGVMIGRGAQGNPWIFSELVEYEKTGVMPERPSNEELKDMMLRHARLQIQYKGEYLGIREMRKHVSWYTTGLKNSAKLRGEINAVESYEELSKLLDEKI